MGSTFSSFIDVILVILTLNGISVLELVVAFEGSRETKIDHFESKGVFLGDHHEVLRLEVSVTHSIYMTVINGIDDLFEKNAGLGFLIEMISDDSVEKLSSRAELNYEVDISKVLEVVNQS